MTTPQKLRPLVGLIENVPESLRAFYAKREDGFYELQFETPDAPTGKHIARGDSAAFLHNLDAIANGQLKVR
jgi:hypothetical protein